MATRPLFPQGVEVIDTDLQLEANTRQTVDATNLVALATAGTVSGLEVTINASNRTLIDIAVGAGFAPNGEYIEVTVPIIGLALSSYVNLVQNNVCLVYTEIASNPRAHETSGTAPNTRVTRSYRAVVLTADEYAALPATSTDMTVNALDRTMFIAAQFAAGFTGSTANNLSPTLLATAAARRVLANPISARMPSTPAVTGVEIRSVTSTLNSTTGAPIAIPLGNASLSLNTTVDPPQLTFTANGDAAGTPVALTTVASYTATSGTPSFAKLLVYANPEFFPSTVAATYTDTVVVEQVVFADQSLHDLSAIDSRVRRTNGNVIQNSDNPFGIRGSDVSKVLRVQQGIALGTGRPSNAAHSLIPRLTSTMIAVGERNLISSWVGINTGMVSRVYINELDEKEETVNCYWSSDDSAWVKDLEGTGATLKLQTDYGDLFFVRDPAAASPWTWSPSDYASYQDRTILAVKQGVTLRDTGASATEARAGGFTSTIDTGTTTRWLINQQVDASSSYVIRQYHFNGTGTPVKEETINASWDGTNWNRDSGALYAVRRVLHPAIGTYQEWVDATATASWVDGAWLSTSTTPVIPGNETRVTDGRITFGATPTTYSNPTATTGFTNTITAKNTCKAWAHFQFNGTTTPVLLDGFNIEPVITADGTTGEVGIGFKNDMQSTYEDYSVAFSYGGGLGATVGVAPDAPFPISFMVTTYAYTGFLFKVIGFLYNAAGIYVVDPTGHGVSELATDPAGTPGTHVTIQVFGKQA